MRKGKYYFVADDAYGQHGCFIEEVYLTKEEYREKTSHPRLSVINGERGFITKSYEAALYYTQD